MTRSSLFRLPAWSFLALVLPACGTRGDGTLQPTVAPGIPSFVVSRAGNRSVLLQWVDSAQGARYTVLRSPLPQGPFFPVSVPSGFQGANRYVDSNLVNGTTYYYQIVAANGFGTGLPSTTVSGTPGFKAVAASCSISGSDNLVVLRDGTVWEWGGTPTFSFLGLPLQVTGLRDVTSVSSGWGHNLALASDGSIWGWGDNSKGQLGVDGSMISPPARVPTLTDAIAVVAAGAFSLALTHDGRVWAWGRNDEGELGTGSATPAVVSVPQPVPGLSDILAISGGQNHGVALRKDGLVFVWGDNTGGQLGIGGTAPGPIGVTQVPGLTGITAISAGSYYTLALRDDGTVWGWGDNSTGQIGVGTCSDLQVSPQIVPVPRPASGVTGAVGIAASQQVSLAVKGDGTVWAWGSNFYGMLGTGTAGEVNPVPTPGPAPALSNIALVSVSATNCLALGADGTVYTWGDNSLGQLGNGSGSNVTTPFEMPNLTGATAVAAGFAFSLYARDAGTAHGVGWTDRGQVGDGGGLVYSRSLPYQIPIPAGVTALAAGDAFGLALTATGEVWGWGQNDHHQVGDAVGADPTSPVPVLLPTGIIAIAAGSYHGLAIRKDPGTQVQTVWAWGSNGAGECGAGIDADPIPTPTPVLGISGVVSIAAGQYHSLAVLSDGTVWGWGLNTFGQLGQSDPVTGDPTPSTTTVPLKVPGITNAVAVAAGALTSYALLGDGTVLAWGWGQDGALGTGGDPSAFINPMSSTPLRVLNLTGVSAITGGSYFALALKSDGTIWSWGSNSNGQLGNPVVSASSVPVQVQGITSAVRIAAGQNHSLALLSNGTIRAWGDNLTSELGSSRMQNSVTPVVVTH